MVKYFINILFSIAATFLFLHGLVPHQHHVQLFYPEQDKTETQNIDLIYLLEDVFQVNNIDLGIHDLKPIANNFEQRERIEPTYLTDNFIFSQILISKKDFHNSSFFLLLERIHFNYFLVSSRLRAPPIA